MRHKSNKIPSSLPVESSVKIEATSKRFKPLSYYLNGGIDIDNDALKQTTDVEFDNEEQLKELEQAGASSVPYGDPRVSKFDLVEQYSKHEAKKASSKSPKGAPVNNAGDDATNQTNITE